MQLTEVACFQCHRRALVSIIACSDVSFPVPPDDSWVCTACSRCGIGTTDIATVFVSYPIVTRFLVQRERCITEPHELLEHDGRPVIRVRLTDVMSADQLTVLLDVQTLHLLAVF